MSTSTLYRRQSSRHPRLSFKSVSAKSRTFIDQDHSAFKVHPDLGCTSSADLSNLKGYLSIWIVFLKAFQKVEFINIADEAV